MKRTRLSTLILSALPALSLQAANIAWVSLHSADDAPSGAAATAGFNTAPDAGYTKLLASKGHRVTRFVTVDNIDGYPDLIAALNTNDLVILSRSVASGHYEVASETAVWNTLTAPAMILNGYLTRNTRLGFTTGGTMVDHNSNPLRLRVNTPLHPIFSGIALDSTNLMVNPYAGIATFTNATSGQTSPQNGISVNNNTAAAGANVLANIGTAGDAALNGAVIAEYPEGTILNNRDTVPSRRLVFLTGSRERNITSEGAGIYDLLPDGEKMFLNAVTYLTTPLAPVFTRELASGANLVAGDRWTFNPGALGTLPITYQWFKNGQVISGAEGATLVFNPLATTDAGEYYVIAANALGKATSTVARLQFATYASPNLTNGIISYWPLDNAVGGKTPDVVSSYDLSLVNMGPANIANGKFGKAFAFTNSAQTLLQRIHNPGEDLPISQKPNFTVSFWVNGPGQSDHRVFSEGSTLQNNTLFNIGTHNAGTDGSVDVYIRSDTGALALDHVHSQAIAYDEAWHHVAYVQRDVGGGLMRALLYVDGAQDPVEIAPIRPLTPNTTAVGGILRAAASAWFTGLVDEVAVWDRALSPEEIQILQVTTITNAPSRVQPLAINLFRADRPAIVKGSSVALRWDTSKDVTEVSITGLGDVTSKTYGGVGSNVVTLTETTTYTLTAKRGSEVLTAATTIAVLDGVASGWTLLDNFDRYTPGPASAPGFWTDARGNSAQFVSYKGNTALKTTTGDSIVYLPLRDLTVPERQMATLFFRMITGTNTAAGITNIVGLTDKVQRNYGDSYQNVGPVVYAAALTNTQWGIETNAWYLGARNGSQGNNISNPIDYPAEPLQADAVYNVWIDINNGVMADYVPDNFTVYIQKEGSPERKVLFQDYQSDRDFFYVESVLGGMLPNLDKLIVLGNQSTFSAVFDDFYLSRNGYNATVPRSYGFTGQTGPLPPLQVGWSGAQLEIKWTSGVLQEAASPNGPWSDVTGATSPSYKVTPTAGLKFYRARP